MPALMIDPHLIRMYVSNVTHKVPPTPQAGLYSTCNIEFIVFIPLGTLGQVRIHHVQVCQPRTSVTTMLTAQNQSAAAECCDSEKMAG